MPQSLSSILIHLVFSTKNRERLISAVIEPELHAYLAAVFHECKSPALAIGGHEDHIHALFALSRSATVADVVEEVKKRSSKWIKTKDETLR
jgi:REP element-mobilizing transposase RayT